MTDFSFDAKKISPLLQENFLNLQNFQDPPVSASRRRLPGTGGPEGVNLPMDGISIPLTGRNSLMDWGLWLLLIGLIALYFWLAFRRKK